MIGKANRHSVHAPLQVLVYSHDSSIRSRVRTALGMSPDKSVPPIAFTDAATQAAVLRRMASGDIDVAVLDGESSPAGGIGIAKQLKDELAQCPPIAVLTGRADDAWLAGWSRADAAVPHPVDPIALTEAIVRLLRGRLVT